MIRGFEGLIIGSENPRKLSDFYKDVVGLTCTNEIETGEEGEEGFLFENIGSTQTGIYIMHHSKVKGKNHGPDRIIFNLEVDGIEDEVKRIEKKGAKKIQDIYHIEGYGLIATFEDVDGNYFQFVQIREPSN